MQMERKMLIKSIMIDLQHKLEVYAKNRGKQQSAIMDIISNQTDAGMHLFVANIIDLVGRNLHPKAIERTVEKYLNYYAANRKNILELAVTDLILNDRTFANIMSNSNIQDEQESFTFVLNRA